jgi:hypothetical protein
MVQSKESFGIAIGFKIRHGHAGSPIQKLLCPTIYNRSLYNPRPIVKLSKISVS